MKSDVTEGVASREASWPPFPSTTEHAIAAGCGDAQWIHKTALLGQLLAVSYRGGDDLRLFPIAGPSSWLQIRSEAHVFYVNKLRIK